MTTKEKVKRRILSIEKSCEYLGGISKVSLYNRVNEGELTLIKIGRRSFITLESLDAYLDRCIEAAGGGDAA
ncbi:helix-turn-helix domain-containing protein [Gordonia lacunae]|uniref:helix-turn-helix domain-containing protein n=1 Tax=Gordonia lacunae TaxID=417102 RepID=UPI0039E2D7A0